MTEELQTRSWQADLRLDHEKALDRRIYWHAPETKELQCVKLLTVDYDTLDVLTGFYRRGPLAHLAPQTQGPWLELSTDKQLYVHAMNYQRQTAAQQQLWMPLFDVANQREQQIKTYLCQTIAPRYEFDLTDFRCEYSPDGLMNMQYFIKTSNLRAWCFTGRVMSFEITLEGEKKLHFLFSETSRPILGLPDLFGCHHHLSNQSDK